MRRCERGVLGPSFCLHKSQGWPRGGHPPGAGQAAPSAPPGLPWPDPAEPSPSGVLAFEPRRPLCLRSSSRLFPSLARLALIHAPGRLLSATPEVPRRLCSCGGQLWDGSPSGTRASRGVGFEAGPQ